MNITVRCSDATLANKEHKVFSYAANYGLSMTFELSANYGLSMFLADMTLNDMFTSRV